MPEWDAYFEYAEQYGIEDPGTVPERVSIRTWCRWLIRTKAISARRACDHAQRSDHWAEELSSGEIALKVWAEADA